MVVIEQAGHFLQLERPGEVNEHVLAWVTGERASELQAGAGF
jgi:pimeloyl-ACP methyl ester carboxylesterase